MINTYAQSSLPIVEPAMKRTLYTFLVHYFSSDSHIGSQMLAVGLQSKGLSFLRSKDNNILSSNVHCFRFTILQIFRMNSNIPSVRICWQWATNIFIFGVVVSNYFECNTVEICVICEIKNKDDNNMNGIWKYFVQLRDVGNLI